MRSETAILQIAAISPIYVEPCTQPSLARLRDIALPLDGGAGMDLNYILGREQVSLHNADIAVDVSARFAHRELARSYGRLLEQAGFPHTDAARTEAERAEAHNDICIDRKGAA